MNNKGFTLVELIATIVLISLVTGIASYNIINVINESKIKSERVFVDKLATAIQSYLSVEGRKISNKNIIGNFKKCRLETDEENECPDGYEQTISLNELQSIDLKEITTGPYKTINEKEIINPRTKEKCLLLDNDKIPKIRIFKDSDFVYYYYIDLSKNNTSCEILDENSIITNIPKNICTILDGTYNEGLCKL